MDFEKDNLEDDNELSRLEDDEELGGETEEIVETEEEELVIVGDDSEEEAPAPKPAAVTPTLKCATGALPCRPAMTRALGRHW